MLLDLWKAFLVGGVICAIGQILIDYTKLTPARILTAFVVSGVILSAVGSISRSWILPEQGHPYH